MNGYCENDYISNQQKEDFFLRIEYCKRHFEEFLEKEYELIDVRECIYKYDREISLCMYNPSSDRKSIEIDIDTVSFLYDISKKYKVYASDILYPTDMKDLLNRLGDKSFYLPFFDPFDEEDDSIHTFEKYGYLLVANEDDKKTQYLYRI